MNETEGRLLEEAVQSAGSIAIAGHIRPDGDCVGACLGLYNYLQENYNSSFDKEITVYMEDIPEAFRFLKNSEKPVWEFSQKKKYDLFIVLEGLCVLTTISAMVVLPGIPYCMRTTAQQAKCCLLAWMRKRSRRRWRKPCTLGLCMIPGCLSIRALRSRP